MKKNLVIELQKIKFLKDGGHKPALIIYFAILGFDKEVEKFGGVSKFKRHCSKFYARNTVNDHCKKIMLCKRELEEAFPE